MNLLNQLPLPQRSVLLLHFVEDFSLEEIARITETQLGTVKSRIALRQKALRKLLEEKMKTPRDILFARHQAAAPKLDAIRREVVAELNNQETKEQSRPHPFCFVTLLFKQALAGTILALPPDLGRSGGGLDFDFCCQFLAARPVRTDGAKISAAVAGNDPDVPAAGKIAGRIDRPNETQAAEPPKTFSPQTKQRAAD
jgi:predicted DNA-binding protein YlxM (UPF0122 family)